VPNQYEPREDCRKCGSNDWAYRKASGVQYGKRFCRECNREKARRVSTPRKRLIRYGITEDQYNARLIEQNGLCAICGNSPSEQGGKALAIDHDHGTGLLRGLLCDGCNKGLGLLQDSVDVVGAALEYLKRHKGGGLG
jgi:hypothetical protein